MHLVQLHTRGLVAILCVCKEGIVDNALEVLRFTGLGNLTKIVSEDTVSSEYDAFRPPIPAQHCQIYNRRTQNSLCLVDASS